MRCRIRGRGTHCAQRKIKKEGNEARARGFDIQYIADILIEKRREEGRDGPLRFFHPLATRASSPDSSETLPCHPVL